MPLKPLGGARALAIPLRVPRFRALFAAHLVSNLGDWLAFLALFGLAALEWQASAARTATLAVAYVLPLAGVAPLAGVLVDRWDLRRVLVASDLLRASLLVGMAACGDFWTLAALLFLHQSFGCFFNPAQAAALPRLVPGEHLLEANALVSGAAHLSKLLGPVVAGLLVARFGARGCFLADAASFALSAAALAALPALPAVREPAQSGAWSSMWAELCAGWRFLCEHAAVRAAVARVAVTMVALGACLAVLPVHARDRLHAGAPATGVLLSTLGAGAILGALGVTRLARWTSKPAAMAAGMLVVAVGLVGLAASAALPPAIAAIGVLGAGAAAVLVPAQALVQEETPRPLLGRTTSAAVAAIGLAQAASMGAAGIAAGAFGVPRLLLAGAVLLAISSLFGVPALAASRSRA